MDKEKKLNEKDQLILNVDKISEKINMFLNKNDHLNNKKINEFKKIDQTFDDKN